MKLLRAIIGLIIFIVTGCCSVQKFEGNGDLCGIVIDENNEPISGFIVTCKVDKYKEKSVFTNDSGIFVINDLPAGDYFISGKKRNYVGLEKVIYPFYQRDKFICCQVMGIDSALDKVEELVSLGEIDEAIQLLDSIYVEQNTNEENVISIYREMIINNGGELDNNVEV